MKKILITISLIACCSIIPLGGHTQIPIINMITAVIKKVITAMDIKVQQLQNKTLALQNMQQQLQNKLSQSKLGDINGWLKKEKDLYQGYYDELKQVKTVIADYGEVKRVVLQQKQIITEYQQAYSLFRNDPHFSGEELRYMENIYSGIMQESVRNLNELMLAVSAFKAQLSDAERMALIHKASGGMRANLDHLRQFNLQNIQLSLARSRDIQENETIRAMYGIGR